MTETTRPVGRMAVFAAVALAVGAAGLVKLPGFYLRLVPGYATSFGVFLGYLVARDFMADRGASPS